MTQRTPRLALATAAVALLVMASFVAESRAARGEPTVEVAAAEVSDARGPSISADGRWVVFTGTVGPRRTVLRTDLVANTTVELSPVPDSAPSGDTIQPELSADGCVVVGTSHHFVDDRPIRSVVGSVGLPDLQQLHRRRPEVACETLYEGLIEVAQPRRVGTVDLVDQISPHPSFRAVVSPEQRERVARRVVTAGDDTGMTRDAVPRRRAVFQVENDPVARSISISVVARGAR